MIEARARVNLVRFFYLRPQTLFGYALVLETLFPARQGKTIISDRRSVDNNGATGQGNGVGKPGLALSGCVTAGTSASPNAI